MRHRAILGDLFPLKVADTSTRPESHRFRDVARAVLGNPRLDPTAP